MVAYLEIILEFANVMIALFAFIYGILFLGRTVNHEHKKPWIFLTVSMIVFCVYQLILLLQSFSIINTQLETLQLVLGTAFASVVLFSFVMQTDLIFKFPYILIEKKRSDRKTLNKSATKGAKKNSTKHHSGSSSKKAVAKRKK
jgi:hypothetical protein